MKEVDYIIVGFGLAGMAFCDQLSRTKLKYVVIDEQRDAASRVAAGLINPVTLKRYTMPYKGEEQFDLASKYFQRLAASYDKETFEILPVLKIFSSIEDQNNWFEASDKPILRRFLNEKLVKNTSEYVEAPLQLGEVNESLRINIPQLLNAYIDSLKSKALYYSENFDHSAIAFNTDSTVTYKNFIAKRIVFAEGFGIKNNPFFNKLPLVGNKGEYLIIKAPNLNISEALKASFFVIPLGGDYYKVGATFNWKEKDTIPTTEARDELQSKLEKVITCAYTIEKQVAGMRPTTGDRRPLIGVHPKYPQLALLNGLGTRGTMMSPYLAQVLFDHLENGISLDDEVSILRFPKKLV